MEYTPKFIENMTQEEISAEIKRWHDYQYRYGRSIDWNRMYDLEYTLKMMKKEMEDKDMADSKKITFEINGTKYNSNDMGNRFYRTIGSQKVRISEAEWLSAMDAYNAECDSHLPNWTEVDEWEQEADAEKEARENKQAKDAKAAEKAVAKKAKKAKKRSKKNIAFTFTGKNGTETTLTEKQVDFIKHVPDTCFYENGLDSAIWIDVLADEIGGQFANKPMTVGAMVSTLREKEIISVGEDRVNGKKCKFFEFTELGKALAGELGLK